MRLLGRGREEVEEGGKEGNGRGKEGMGRRKEEEEEKERKMVGRRIRKGAQKEGEGI